MGNIVLRSINILQSVNVLSLLLFSGPATKALAPPPRA